jgi:hypothetical protein
MFNQLVSDEAINNAARGLRSINVEPIIVANGQDALAKIKELIPPGASVMNGASVSLETIGFVDYLKSGQHGWNNLHELVLAEKDPAKQAILRKQSVVSDFYLGSVHALLENGQFLIASNSGSQLPHVVYTSTNLIFVVGIQKIVKDFAQGLKRIEEYVIPLEDQRMKSRYGVGTNFSKMVFFRYENPNLKRNIKMILVKEVLGF